jgi:TPR repeat protein
VTSSKTALEIEGPLPSWLEDPLPAAPEAVTKAAVSCARGNAIDCMRAGDSYDAGRGVQPNERQARLNRVAGARLFERACKKRDPDACYSLSVIYSMGLGVKRNPEIAQGHMMITQRLCRSVPADLCKRLPKAATE